MIGLSTAEVTSKVMSTYKQNSASATELVCHLLTSPAKLVQPAVWENMYVGDGAGVPLAHIPCKVGGVGVMLVTEPTRPHYRHQASAQLEISASGSGGS